MRRYYVSSLILHVLILFMAMPSLEQQKMSGKDGTTSKNEEDGKFEETQVEIIELAPADGASEVKCESFFGGIGVTVSFAYPDGRIRITEVYRGYPAANHDLRINDYIRPINSDDIQGEVGTVVVIEVIRDGMILTKTMRRAKICTR